MSDSIMRENLMALANAYADATGLSLTTISKRIHGKQSFFAEYGAGKQTLRVNHYWYVIDRFREEWPDGTPWPKTRSIPPLVKSLDESARHNLLRKKQQKDERRANKMAEKELGETT
jgi:hypothetical protein